MSFSVSSFRLSVFFLLSSVLRCFFLSFFSLICSTIFFPFWLLTLFLLYSSICPVCLVSLIFSFFSIYSPVSLPVLFSSPLASNLSSYFLSSLFNVSPDWNFLLLLSPFFLNLSNVRVLHYLFLYHWSLLFYFYLIFLLLLSKCLLAFI